jgi:murein DD-endopeptidase MepM/ murein hydrolase activator NlpD
MAPVVRALRILALLLGVTGCAVDAPRPATVLPPRDTGPAPLPAPVPPPIVSSFGAWRGEGGGPPAVRHAGIDIRAPVGTPVLAAADGVVLRTGTQAFAGRLVILGHAETLATVYFHLSAVTVSVGRRVRRGDEIGRVGTSGNATAPHLHFGVCRRPGGLCGEPIEAGWADPLRSWVTGNPCHAPGRAYAAEEHRLTYPLPCLPGRPAA